MWVCHTSCRLVAFEASAVKLHLCMHSLNDKHHMVSLVDLSSADNSTLYTIHYRWCWTPFVHGPCWRNVSWFLKNIVHIICLVWFTTCVLHQLCSVTSLSHVALPLSQWWLISVWWSSDPLLDMTCEVWNMLQWLMLLAHTYHTNVPSSGNNICIAVECSWLMSHFQGWPRELLSMP